MREYENEREQAATSFRKRFPRTYLLAKNSALLMLGREVYLSLRKGASYQRRLLGKTTPGEERKWEAMRSELLSFKRLAEKHRFQAIVVTIPARLQVKEKLPNSLYPSRILKMCDELELPAISVLDDFTASLAEGVDPYLPWDNHLSPDGHRLVARAIRMHILAAGPSRAPAGGKQ